MARFAKLCLHLQGLSSAQIIKQNIFICLYLRPLKYKCAVYVYIAKATEYKNIHLYQLRTELIVNICLE